MKNLFLIVCAVLPFVFGSCKKDYTCTCTNLPYGLADKNIEIKDVKKNDAELVCDHYYETHFENSKETKCEIK